MGMGPRAHLRNRSAGVGRVLLGFVRGASGDHSGCDHARSLHGAWSVMDEGTPGAARTVTHLPACKRRQATAGGRSPSLGRRRTCGALTTAGTAGRLPFWASLTVTADERGVSARERAGAH